MQLETFRARDLARALAAARAELGEDAAIVRTRSVGAAGLPLVEVTAGRWSEVEGFRRRFETKGPVARRGGARGRPAVVALVGPTGAGKTTTIAKLLFHTSAFADARVGVVTLDTFRVAAVEHVGLFAELRGAPLEVVYRADEADGAIRRLAGCDVVLVDTPGRSPRHRTPSAEWEAQLAALRPDEVHLVLPATIRTDVALATRDAFAGCGPTHLLLTKIDEVPEELGVLELAGHLGLPGRWATDGQEIPDDLRPGCARVLASLSAAGTSFAGAS